MITKDYLITEHTEKKRTITEIAQELGLTRGGVKYYLKKYNLSVITKKGGQTKDLLKQRFGKLLVVELLENKSYHTQSVWKCECDCGNIVEVCTGSLVRNKTKSCGCYNKEQIKKRGHEKYTGSKYVPGKKITNIIKNAKHRKIYCIDKNALQEEIDKVFEEQNFKCIYSGEDLRFYDRDDNGNIIPKSGNASVDRIDSKKGYIEGNLQICTKVINVAKMAVSHKDFLLMIETIYNHSIKGK